MCAAAQSDAGGPAAGPPEADWKVLEDALPMTVSSKGGDAKGVLLYRPPSWTCASPDPKILDLSLQIISNGVILETVRLNFRSHYVLGSTDECDFVYRNPQVSRKHLVLQFTRSHSFVVFDLNSTCGTTVNHKRLLPERYYMLSVGDQLRIGKRGMSSRTYVVTGHSIFTEHVEALHTKAAEAKRKPKESDVDKVKKIRKIERELEDELGATKADESHYDTELYLDEYDAFFDDARQKDRKKETVLNRADIIATLWRLQRAEIELLNGWYAALKEATNAAPRAEPESSIELELAKVRTKELEKDRARIQKALDGVREELDYNFKLLRVASF